MPEIAGTYPPTLAHLGGKLYAVSGSTWVEVPKGTKLDEVVWLKPPELEAPERPEAFERMALSSDGKTYYRVTIRTDGSKWCTCTGYLYRRKCRHVEEFLTDLKRMANL